MCDGALRLGVDFVFARSKLGNQSTIAQLLTKNMEEVVGEQDKGCVDQVFRVLCQYYLPRCGNATLLATPSSICREECGMVQEDCSETWDVVMTGFEAVDHVIECNATSKLLFPAKHCCTGAGLG